MKKKRPRPKTELAVYVNHLIRNYPDRFPTKGSVAEQMGMIPSGLSRAMYGDGGVTVEQCLRLAIAVRTDLSAILHLVGRHTLADQTHKAFKVITDDQLTGDERKLVDWWRGFSEFEREGLRKVMLALRDARRASGA